MGDFFITDILRSIFFVIDKGIYGLIEIVYSLFLQIANTTIFSNDVFEEFSGKVYALLGIFMLFKVSFSVLSYIVNPDEFTDKSKGMSKLITNILISLVLIIGVPIIFTQAMEIQQIILKDDVIPKLFSSAESQIYISSQDPDDGSDMALWTFNAFYASETEISSLEEVFNDDVNRRNANETEYAVEYSIGISSIVGFVVLLLLVSFCFDIALRSIKLGFLQMIAPIPIISRIDPKKGNEIFNKWVKTCLSTYLDLFVRLAGIFFAVYIIKLVKQSGFVDVVTGEPTSPSKLAIVFIIIGSLMFAKHLPKLIKDLTGLDMGTGNFTLNPFKKFSQVPVLGAATSSLASIAGGAVAGGIAGHEAGHTARGAIQGAMGAAAGLKGKVSLSGDKNPGFIGSAIAGSQSGYKAITGNDYAIFNPLRHDMFKHGENEIEDLKSYKYKLQDQQSILDAELHSLHNQYENANTDSERNRIMADINRNRSNYGKISKHISTLDDQISDIKRIYKFDESKRGDVAEAKEYADNKTGIKHINNTTIINNTTNVNNTDSTHNTTETKTASQYNPYPNNQYSDTSGGVPVSKTSNGERTTQSGIWIPDSPNNIDKK